jgi:hypothetical protein
VFLVFLYQVSFPTRYIIFDAMDVNSAGYTVLTRNESTNTAKCWMTRWRLMEARSLKRRNKLALRDRRGTSGERRTGHVWGAIDIRSRSAVDCFDDRGSRFESKRVCYDYVMNTASFCFQP